MRTNYINPTEIVILDLTYDGKPIPSGLSEGQKPDEPTGINTEKAINESIDLAKSNLKCRRVKCNDQQTFITELKNINKILLKIMLFH